MTTNLATWATSLRRAAGQILLSVVVLLLTAGAAELAVRVLDGYPLLSLRLPSELTRPAEGSLADVARTMPLADGVDPAWIDSFPSPPGADETPDADLLDISESHALRVELEAELYRVWNSNFVREYGCVEDGDLSRFPGPLRVFEAVEPGPQPVYRYPLRVSTPVGLETNRFGWRGPDLPLDKPMGVVRVAFVGASTTVGQHSLPFSYPEFVLHWLNVWADAQGYPFRFDGINGGREGLNSASFVAIVRQELLPMEPDLVVYYEGANQFFFPELIDVPAPKRRRPGSLASAGWADFARRWWPWSAILRRVDHQVQALAVGDGSEPDKPDYRLAWPDGVDELDPDIRSQELPVHLPRILRDLDAIRTDVARAGAELAVSSFVWVVEDGMRIERHKIAMWELLNRRWWPYRYRDMRRLADFQNRVYRRYADARGLPFVDVAAAVPKDPRFFVDSVHFSAEGTRLHAWAVLNELVPLARGRIEARRWPRPDRQPLREHPNIRAPLRYDGCDDFVARHPAKDQDGPGETKPRED